MPHWMSRGLCSTWRSNQSAGDMGAPHPPGLHDIRVFNIRALHLLKPTTVAMSYPRPPIWKTTINLSSSQ